MYSQFLKPAIFSVSVLLSISISISISTSALAEPVNNLAIDPVIVTANRYSENITDVLATVTLITRQDIEHSNATNLEELLVSVPGLDVKNSGSYGKLTSVFMRGTNSDHTLTIIDGVKLFSASGGSTAFQHIPLHQIERIEIIKGPRSGLYGSDAIGGVIQIFTRNGHGKSEKNVSIEAGSHNTKEVIAGISGSTKNLNYTVNIDLFETDGFDAIEHTALNDNDGYDNNSINANLKYQITKSLDATLHLLNASGSTLYDNCLNSSFTTSDNCYSDIEQRVISTQINYKPDAVYDFSLKIGQSADLSDNFWENTPNNTYDTVHSDITVQSNIQIADDHLLVAGFEDAKDEVEATPYDSKKSRGNQAGFISWKGLFDQTTVNVSMRNDDNEQFGSHTTGSIAVGYTFDKSINMFASYGTAFKAPTFTELYFPGYANPDLEPEESESFEIGMKQTQATLNWEVSVYHTTIDNLISGEPPSYIAKNISKAEIDGIEATVKTKIAGWNAQLSTAYVEPINKDAANLGKVLQTRIKQSTSIDINRQFGKTFVSAKILNQGKRYITPNNDQVLDGYTLLDVKVRQNISKSMSVSGSINNVFDEDYTVNTGFGGIIYNTPGRTFFVNLQYKM